MDHEKLASEWLKALRGRRSQSGFARRLGYRSNVVSRWEGGQSFPTAAQALTAAQRSGIDVAAALSRFFFLPRPWMGAWDGHGVEMVAALLDDLRGSTPVSEVAKESGFSRFRIARWLSGDAEPRLPDFLKLIDVMSLRLCDFIEVFTDPDQLPSLKPTFRRVRAARAAAFERPGAHAVLRVLELESYRGLRQHRAGYIAEQLGISRDEEEQCLLLLRRAGQIRLHAGRWQVKQPLAVDLRSEPLRLRALKAFWLDRAKDRLDLGPPATFAFNVFAVSKVDMEAIREMHLAFYQQVQAKIASSETSEVVGLFSTQLVSLTRSGNFG